MTPNSGITRKSWFVFFFFRPGAKSLFVDVKKKGELTNGGLVDYQE